MIACAIHATYEPISSYSDAPQRFLFCQNYQTPRQYRAMMARQRESDRISAARYNAHDGIREARKLTRLPIHRRQPNIARWARRTFG